MHKEGSRTETINLILDTFNRETSYLEIGTRNPDHNFNRVSASKKYSVDPGVEFKKNPVDFKMTSDVFFDKFEKREILSESPKFDLIFIDGLHLAEQVDKDIQNALKHIKEDGFIVLHDCNPPTEWHARETYNYRYSPAGGIWNGTTWKAFLKWRSNPEISSCCVDTDWGMGVLSKTNNLGKGLEHTNPFYEFDTLNKNRKKLLNLLSFQEFKNVVATFNSK